MNDVLASGTMNSNANGENVKRTAGVSGLPVIESHARTHGDKQTTSNFHNLCERKTLGLVVSVSGCS